MKIVVASINAIKLDTVKTALYELNISAEIIGVEATSGVPEQASEHETLQGAKNRILHAKILAPNADTYIAFQNGIFKQKDGNYIDKAAIIIETKDGEVHQCFSKAVVFSKDWVEKARQKGFDKTTVGKEMATASVVSKADDPHASLVGMTRKIILVDTLKSQLAKVFDEPEIILAQPSLDEKKPLTTKLLLNAESFGFGPTAAIVDFFPFLRQKFKHISFIGQGHSLDLQRNLNYDAIYDLSEQSVSDNLSEIMRAHDLFFSAIDFKMGGIASKLGVPTVIYDPLAWFFPQIPDIVKEKNVFYIAQNFFGVEERLKNEAAQFGKTQIVPPIVPKKIPHGKKTIVLVNLGGISNPYWSHEENVNYARTMINALRNIIPSNETLFFVTSEKIAATLKDPQVNTYERQFIINLLPLVKYAVMTPGLSNIYDSAVYNIPTLFLPPANDSQGQQLILIKQNAMIDAAIDWPDIFPALSFDYKIDQATSLKNISSSVQTLSQSAEHIKNFSVMCQQAFAMLGKLTQSKTAKLIERFGSGGAEAVADAVVKLASALELSNAYYNRPRAKAVVEKHFSLAGGKTALLSSNSALQISDEQLYLLGAHLPGIQPLVNPVSQPDIHIEHIESSQVVLKQNGSRAEFHDQWSGKLSSDFVHLLYSASRLAWLNDGILPIHAACVGTEAGCILLVGHPGVGKSSITLQAALNANLKVFSGDKTLVKIDGNGEMVAVGGTSVMTIRSGDLKRWPVLQDCKGIQTSDRFSFNLKPEQIIQSSAVKIIAIALVQLNDGVDKNEKFSDISALHTLYPYFIDTERADVILANGKAVFSGSLTKSVTDMIVPALKNSLTKIPTYQICGPIATVVENISALCIPQQIEESIVAKDPKKILFGICGIGNGHTFRQLPIVKYFAEHKDKVLIFGYGESYRFYANFAKGYPNVAVEMVANPYYKGDSHGLDFSTSSQLAENQQDFNRINCVAMANAERNMGCPDLVICDYEKTAADYAYAKGALVVTLDQQSKYLIGDFPKDLNGQSYVDEVMRLGMFFPLAEKRLACSFFQVTPVNHACKYKVEIVPPVLRDAITQMQRTPKIGNPLLLVYLTAQKGFGQSVEEMLKAISAVPSAEYHIFLPKDLDKLPVNMQSTKFYYHGDEQFENLLSSCNGIISTAGHTLLSEAMHLGIPVFAMPLSLYEQEMNAVIIGQNKFGMSDRRLTQDNLNTFVNELATYTKNILNDKSVLVRGAGQDAIIKTLIRLLRNTASSKAITSTFWQQKPTQEKPTSDASHQLRP